MSGERPVGTQDVAEVVDAAIAVVASTGGGEYVHLEDFLADLYDRDYGYEIDGALLADLIKAVARCGAEGWWN